MYVLFATTEQFMEFDEDNSGDIGKFQKDKKTLKCVKDNYCIPKFT